MKTKNRILLIALFVVISTNTSIAQAIDFSEIKTEIKKAVMQEQNAFRNGDCETVLARMDNDITFLANGRRAPSKEMIGNFCNSVKRPFKTPLLDTLDIYPLSNDTAYTIRTVEFLKDETTKIEEFVTKIWKKNQGEWKITHLHSTVKEVAVSN